MTIPDTGDLSYPDLPLADRAVPSRTERLLAAQEGNDIAADINNTQNALRRSLVDELFQAVGPDLDPGDGDGLLRPHWEDQRSRSRLNTALYHIGQARRTSQGRAPSLEGLPATREEFEAFFNERLRDEYEQYRIVLDNAPSGAWAPELGGVLWSELTDAQNLAVGVATAPLGGANVARIAVVEGTAGLLTEAAQFDRRSEAAERLMLPPPDYLESLLFGAVGGAVLGGGLQAGANVLTGRRALTGEIARAAQAAEAPRDRSPLQTENAIQDAARELANDPLLPPAAPARPGGAATDGAAATGQAALARLPHEAPSPQVRIDIEAHTGRPQEQLLNILSNTAQEVFGPGTRIRITSGHEGRSTGTRRHPAGTAADFEIYRPDGSLVEFGAAEAADFMRQAARNGIRGIGYGRDYMGHRFHMDIFPPEDFRGGEGHLWSEAASVPGLREAIDDFNRNGYTGRGVEPDWENLARRIITVESAGDPNAANPNSSAVGLGQMVEGTWLELIGRHRPDLMEGRSRAQILALRTDADLSMQMTVAYTRENAATLQAAGFQPTLGNLYLAHFAGPTGAVNALRAPRDAPILTVMSRQAIAANANIRHQGRRFADFTVGHLINWARSYVGDTGGAAGGRAPGSGASGPAAPIWSPTSRGFTRTGQVTTGTRTIDVEYEVVDASTLRPASGALQPRDRTRAASDEQIAEIAARLDPARLMPAPEADRGAPIVGPDGVIESGNGRVMAIQQAATRFPDRIGAYRSAIRAAGFDVPDDMEVPVLVAWRRSELTDADRQLFVREANTATVARMSASERAGMDAAMIDGPTMERFDPGAALDTPENAAFLRAALGRLPQAERNALVTPEGRLNREGRERINRAIFARAFDDRELLERLAEEQPGELRSLLEALEQAAPSWAALRADIAAGRVAPEFDIGGHVIEAVRIIASARDIARTSGKQVSAIVEELLADNDLLEGLLSPLTQALVRKMYPGGRVLAADKVADFLRRYADEARKIGQGGGLLDAPGPLDALKAIDPETFGDLTETGTPRGQRQPVAQAAPDRAPAPPGRAVPDPDNAAFIDTRGAGRRFHGSRGEIAELDEFTYSFVNFYGQGFYSTDAVAVANGYSRGGKIYELTETGEIRAFSLEQAAPDFLIDPVRAMDEADTSGDILRTAFFDDADQPGDWTVREAFDRARTESGYSAEEIQTAFEFITDVLRERGFNAIDHTGGLNTKKAPHQVRIYLNPRDNVTLTEIDRADVAAQASARAQSGAEAAPARAGTTAAADAAPTTAAPTAAPARAVAPPASASAEDIAASGNLFDLDTEALRESLGDLIELEVKTIDGQTWTAAQLLDELEADIQAYRVIDTCMLGRPG